MANENKRLIFIDHLRAFIFALLAFDHTVHAYALHYGRFHFFKDYDRSIVGDIIYLHNNSIIMPMLFFIFGLFVLPSYHKQGGWLYFRERFLKLGIPYIAGIPFIVPLLVFPRYLFDENPASGYWEFWREIYFTEKIQGGGPFWVLYCLALFSFILIVADRLFPHLISWLGHQFARLEKYPFTFASGFIGISMLLLGYSDLRWGAPWWIGFGHIETDGHLFWIIIDKIINLFHLQGSRFLLHAWYFLAGALVSASGLLRNQDFWKRIAIRWPLWLACVILTGCCYIIYTLNFINDGAYNNEIHRHLRAGKSWVEIWPLIAGYGPGVLLRTSLHGVFVFFQVITLLSIFYRFSNHSHPVWSSLARCSYGIFLLHEIPVIWLQYCLNGRDISIPLKVLLIAGLGFGGSWFLITNLRRFSIFRKII